jgi:hypothetical protein
MHCGALFALASRRVEGRAQLAAAVDLEFVEDGFEVVLERVRRDEQSFAGRSGVEPLEQHGDDFTLSA